MASFDAARSWLRLFMLDNVRRARWPEQEPRTGCTRNRACDQVPPKFLNPNPGPGTIYAEGRDLETIPLPDHEQVYMVLDQGDSASAIPTTDRANLTDQFDAVLAQYEKTSPVVVDNTSGGMLYINTVLSVDTGGDVFGADRTSGNTPDQDFRVQKAISTLRSDRNLVTAVVAPGVDAPHDAPEKALRAGGKVCKPTKNEEKMLLDILREYRMDGSDPARFGKTNLALQARLQGILG